MSIGAITGAINPALNANKDCSASSPLKRTTSHSVKGINIEMIDRAYKPRRNGPKVVDGVFTDEVIGKISADICCEQYNNCQI